MSNKTFNNVIEGMGGATLIGVHLVLGPLLRPWRIKWGATDDEIRRTLPGDELVPKPKWSYTQAITIHASATEVWPWLAQIGQGRGGFYSYEWLENPVGCDIHNADRIMPEFQNLQVGDGVRLAPQMPGFPVAILEPGRAIVLCGDTRTGSVPVPTSKASGDYFATTWGFCLDERGDGTTRLIARFRSDYNDTRRNRLMYGLPLVEPISSIMQRKMLLGIQQRAEIASQSQGGV
jgi:hypothetical protein